MSEPTSLIERAAARLGIGAAPAAASPPPADRPTGEGTLAGRVVPVRPAAPAYPPPAPLGRQVALNVSHLAQTGIVMPWTSSARIVEEYRIIKRNIMSSWQTAEAAGAPPGPRVIMVTSARPREGKTFSSINLALAFAAEEKFVTILIDADTVRRDTAKTLQIPADPGFTGVLSREIDLADALIQTDLPNLVILPPGTPGPHIPELLTSDAPRKLISEIVDRYSNHVIIMDTPPCLASTDPTALAAVADQVVFVVEATHTQRPEIESALSLLSACQNISFILNMVPVGTSEHFGSYYYYYQPKKQNS